MYTYKNNKSELECFSLNLIVSKLKETDLKIGWW